MSHRTMGRMQRAAPLRTMLDYAAIVGLVLATVFQIRIQWTLAGVENPISLEALLVVVTAAALAIVGPALVSALIPNTPAGQLLQRINYRTAGFAVTVAFSLFLIYYTYQMMVSWWMSKPVVEQSGLTNMQAIMMTILMIGVPALAWTQIDPQRLVNELKQAHMVKRYELQISADLGILATTLLRAQVLAAKGVANLLPDERRELHAIVTAYTAGIDQTIGEVEHILERASGAAIPLARLTDYPEITEAQQDLAELLGVMSDGVAGLRDEARSAPQDSAVPLAVVARPDAEWSGARSADAERSGVPRSTTEHGAVRGVNTLSAPVRQGYDQARKELAGHVWDYENLMRVLDCKESKAHALRRAWVAAGLAVEIPEHTGHYRFVELS